MKVYVGRVGTSLFVFCQSLIVDYEETKQQWQSLSEKGPCLMDVAQFFGR